MKARKVRPLGHTYAVKPGVRRSEAWVQKCVAKILPQSALRPDAGLVFLVNNYDLAAWQLMFVSHSP